MTTRPYLHANGDAVIECLYHGGQGGREGSPGQDEQESDHDGCGRRHGENDRQTYLSVLLLPGARVSCCLHG